MAQVQHPIHRNCACHPRFSNTNTHLVTNEKYVDSDCIQRRIGFHALALSFGFLFTTAWHSFEKRWYYILLKLYRRSEFCFSTVWCIEAFGWSLHSARENIPVFSKKSKVESQNNFCERNSNTSHCDYRSVTFCHFTAWIPFLLQLTI